MSIYFYQFNNRTQSKILIRRIINIFIQVELEE